MLSWEAPLDLFINYLFERKRESKAEAEYTQGEISSIYKSYSQISAAIWAELGQSQKLQTHSRCLTWVAGIQLLESSPATSKGLHLQESELNSKELFLFKWAQMEASSTFLPSHILISAYVWIPKAVLETLHKDSG